MFCNTDYYYHKLITSGASPGQDATNVPSGPLAQSKLDQGSHPVILEGDFFFDQFGLIFLVTTQPCYVELPKIENCFLGPKAKYMIENEEIILYKFNMRKLEDGSVDLFVYPGIIILT